MISHELKTIFIHIPRTGGTSVETALVGNNWWKIQPETKHIDWQQAHQHYSEYWDQYLKFTIVRNPWDWLASLYNSHDRGGNKSWEEYVRKPNLYPHEQKSLLQSEIIGHQMDHILRYETLNEDFIRLCQALGIKKSLPCVQLGESDYSHYSGLYTDEQQQLISDLFKEDIDRFGFKFTSREVAATQSYKRTLFLLNERVAELEHELELLRQHPRRKISNFFKRKKNDQI